MQRGDPTVPAFELRQSFGAFESRAVFESGRKLPQSKTASAKLRD